ncbi:MAG TPA: hypothetical protein GXX46_06150 [Peptococcaceae bacterium]|nr:hypothetical protein [Peptococcaceae bacterium]
MKSLKKIFLVIFLISLTAFLLVACSEDKEALAPQSGLVRNGQEVSFSGLSFTPWDVEEAVSQVDEQEHKPYTIMLYLNGSDLETEAAMATGDIIEMIESGFEAESLNVLLLTGGTLKWQNNVIPSETCALYRVAEGGLQLIADIGQRSIGDAGTLASFIDFGMEAFPADKYGLIFWNHGGGSITGYGVDENFGYDGLSLLELNLALEKSLASNTKLEFIGFDACLMATVETAAIAQDYAHYLIASEELEPGYGWDYSFLADLSANPEMGGAELGKIIADKFVAFYADSGEDATLSVIDLSRVNDVLQAMGDLMAACNEDFSQITFKNFAKSRKNTKFFGGGSPRDNKCDMVDICDMAAQLAPYYQEEAEAVIQAVKNAVVYHKYSAGVEGAAGLSTYYVFGGKEQAEQAVEIYKSLAMNPHYTNYLVKFASELTGESIAPLDFSEQIPEMNEEGDYTIQLTQEELDNLLEIYFTVWEPVPDEEDYYFMLGESSDVEIAEDGTIVTEFDGVWPGINGDFVCLYEIGRIQGGAKYAIPAVLNGEDVDIIAVFDEANPDGRIIGARPLSGETGMAAKNMLKIKKGDRLKFLYYAEYFGEDESMELEEWYEGEEFIVGDKLELEWLEVNLGEVYLYGFYLIDVQQNEYYTDFVEVEFIE